MTSEQLKNNEKVLNIVKELIRLYKDNDGYVRNETKYNIIDYDVFLEIMRIYYDLVTFEFREWHHNDTSPILRYTVQFMDGTRLHAEYTIIIVK